MSILSKVRARRVCGHSIGEIEAWLRAHGGRLFDTWSDEKLVLWVLHHGARRRLCVFQNLPDPTIRGLVTFQRIPDDIPIDSAMEWAWEENATAGERLYVSAMAGAGVPLPIFARMIHDVSVELGARRVVCHRRNEPRDLTHVFEKCLSHGIS